MSAQNILAPARAKSSAVALPLPQPGPIEPAPTTTATFPLSRSIHASRFSHDLSEGIGRTAPRGQPGRKGTATRSTGTGRNFALRVVLVPANRPVRGRSFRENAMSFARAIHIPLAAAALLLPLSLANSALAKPFMIVGLDEKILWDDEGKPILSPDGK